jgi:FkbH-like protein
MSGPGGPGPLDVLADSASSLGKTMKALEELEKSGRFAREASLGISSNVTVDLLGVYLRRHALLSGARLRVHPGNHDDVLGDVDRFRGDGVEYLLLLPFFDNLLPAFESQVGRLPPETIAAKEADVRARYRLAFERAKGFRTVFVGAFHRLGPAAGAAADAVDDAIGRFDRVLREEAAAHPNVRMIEMDEIVRAVGRPNAFDLRFYFRAKAPYTTAFLNEFARRLTSATRGFGGYFYKALVLDCDNTLWGGVVGEDLPGGLALGPHDYPGNVYWRVQNELAALQQAGVLLCLCSKNNPEDVEELLSSHPDMVLRDRHFALKSLNWRDKPDNMVEIARSLNIGLDSLVYLDDSDFECAGMRRRLPMVRTFQVPAAISDYPAVIREIRELFLPGGGSDESRDKTEQYRRRAEAEKTRTAFSSNEEFLASLDLKVEVSRDALKSVSRVSELSLKSNQFNLTTRRYGVGDVQKLMESGDSTVYSMSVRDKFGNAGLTGVIVMRWRDGAAVVESFLMSCRVIGRGIEFAVWPEILRDAAARGCSLLRAEFIPTAKNAQVADFFDRVGLPLVSEVEGVRRYETPIAAFPAQKTPWIEVINVQ